MATVLILLGIMMILLSDMSNENLGALIVLAGLILKFVEKVYDNWQLKKAAKVVANEAEAKAVELKTVIAAKTTEIKGTIAVSDAKKQAHLTQQDVKLDAIATTVATVEKQTNGVIEKVTTAAYEKGVADGKAGS